MITSQAALFNEFYDIRLLMPILLATTRNSEHIVRKSFENRAVSVEKMTLTTRRRIEVIKNLPAKRKQTHDFCR